MFAYIPKPYPGEILYSRLARMWRHMGEPPPTRILRRLIGGINCSTVLDLPGHLDHLAGCFPVAFAIDPDWLIDESTLFPYLMAFQTEVSCSVLRAKLKTRQPTLYGQQTGLAAGRSSGPLRLKYCADCAREMEKEHGEVYWRREHQIPGVLVCPRHRCSLFAFEPVAEGLASIRKTFFYASPERCTEDRLPLIPAAHVGEYPFLLRIAQASGELLDHPREVPADDQARAAIARQLRDKGLYKGSTALDRSRTTARLRAHIGRAHELLPPAIRISLDSGYWLNQSVRGDFGIHPLFHLLMKDFLEHEEDYSRQYGNGPWACPNHKVPHTDAHPVKAVRVIRTGNKLRGFFSCPCGYVYSKDAEWDLDGSSSATPVIYAPTHKTVEPEDDSVPFAT